MTNEERQRKAEEAAQFERDLHPHQNQGVNTGMDESEVVHTGRTAHDIKDLHEKLADFTADELRQIPVLPEGTRLQQGAVYLDLAHVNRHEIKAMGKTEAGPKNWYVPKTEVDYQLWNRLIGVNDPVRRGEENEAGG